MTKEKETLKKMAALLAQSKQRVQDLEKKLNRRSKIASLEGDEEAQKEVIKETVKEMAEEAAIPAEQAEVLAEEISELAVNPKPAEGMDEESVNALEEISSEVGEIDDVPESVKGMVEEAVNEEDPKLASVKFAKLVPILLKKLAKVSGFNSVGEFETSSYINKSSSLQFKEEEALKKLREMARK